MRGRGPRAALVAVGGWRGWAAMAAGCVAVLVVPVSPRFSHMGVQLIPNLVKLWLGGGRSSTRSRPGWEGGADAAGFAAECPTAVRTASRNVESAHTCAWWCLGAQGGAGPGCAGTLGALGLGALRVKSPDVV